MTKTLRSMFTLLAIAGGEAYAHEQKPHARKPSKALSTEETPFGREGDPKKVSRTINVDMSDEMRFAPAELEDLRAHAEMMRKHPGMEHDEPYMAHVAPGKAETMIWQFTNAGEFHYGCLVPGHFEAGMIGKVVVKP